MTTSPTPTKATPLHLALILCVPGLMMCQSAPDKLPTKGITLPPPDSSVFLRASFDDDPSPFIGSFLPDHLGPAEIDENQAMKTRCSGFISFKELKASGTYDEYYNSAAQAGVSVGVPGIASGGLSAGKTATVRVRYELTKKMRAEVKDQAGFDQCCNAAPDQCPDFILGEFFYGTGHLFQAVGSQAGFDGEGVTASGVTGGVDFKDEIAWRRQSNFEEVYFAFRKQRVRNSQAASRQDPNDCSWANALPTSLDGTYFVGVSSPALSEADARDMAMRNARTQVVRYLGEYITSASTTTSSAIEGYLQDEKVVSAVSEGLVSKVKDQRWCPAATTETPKGLMHTVKVLTYFPNTEKKAAAKEAVKTLSSELDAQGRLDNDAKAAIQNALGGIK